jgi:hypothetical protein
MAPFLHRNCPRCLAVTWQHFLPRDCPPQDAARELWAICQSCETVLIHKADGSIDQRPATAEERSVLPQPIVLSEEQRAKARKSLRQSRADIRAWLQAGCPGLTSELERALPPGTMDRLKRFVELPEDGVDPEMRA